MGKESREIKKTLNVVGNLDYFEIKNVPMVHYKDMGDAIDAHNLSLIEKYVAQEIILKRLPIHGREVEFFRGVLGYSQREFALKLGLSHVAVLKWEKLANQRLSLINEVAVKTLVSGLLNLKVLASLEALVGHTSPPKKVTLDFSKFKVPHKNAA